MKRNDIFSPAHIPSTAVAIIATAIIVTSCMIDKAEVEDELRAHNTVS